MTSYERSVCLSSISSIDVFVVVILGLLGEIFLGGFVTQVISNPVLSHTWNLDLPFRRSPTRWFLVE